MHVEGHRMPREVDIEECFRRAAEARRLAEGPGITEAERADLLEVERTWLDLATRCASGSTGAPLARGDSAALTGSGPRS
jgi:hypothetical protein